MAAEDSQVGLLIALEGGDCAGKTTQINALREALKGRKVAFRSFPTNRPSVQALLKDAKESSGMHKRALMHMAYAADRLFAEDEISELVNDGYWVITDRYMDSGAAYSIASGVSVGWCDTVEKDLRRPDLVIYLKVPASVASKRAQFGEGDNETLAFQEKVVWAYDAMFVAPLNRASRSAMWIDGTLSPEEVTKEIVRLIERKNVHRVRFGDMEGDGCPPCFTDCK